MPTFPPVSFAEPRFELRERKLDPRTTILSVAGELHVSTAPEFSESLNASISEQQLAVVLDLTAVEFIDSTGLSVLLAALRHVTRRGGQMVVACRNPTVLRLFEITKLDSTFEITPDVDTALARIQGEPAV